MSVLRVVEAPADTAAQVPDAAATAAAPVLRQLRPTAGLSARKHAYGTVTAIVPRSSSMNGGSKTSLGSARSPIRLTRRGRVVVSGLIVVVVTAAALLLTLVASGRAQATNHGQPGAGYRGMREVVVQPGQTLWSIAAAAEPSADTRIVIEQIISANALPGTNVRAGQLLWVPR